MPSNASSERRTSLRIPCNLKAKLLTDSETLTAELMNISEHGAFIRSAIRSPKDSTRFALRLRRGVELALQLEIAGRMEGYEARGHVAWQSDFGVGVDFSELSAPLQTLIRNMQT